MFIWDTYKDMLEYILDFGLYGEKEAAKRCKDYPGIVLTTAHSSKGMEWPIVINEISKYHDKNLVNEDVEEKRRLFFVSATRARDELYIVSQRYAYGSKGNGKNILDSTVSIEATEIGESVFFSKEEALRKIHEIHRDYEIVDDKVIPRQRTKQKKD